MKMQHPNSKRTVTVKKDMAGTYQSQGWREVSEPDEKQGNDPKPGDPK